MTMDNGNLDGVQMTTAEKLLKIYTKVNMTITALCRWELRFLMVGNYSDLLWEQASKC